MENGNGNGNGDNKLTLVVCSGDMDKVMASFIIATGAAASGMDVMMFFTFWGLKALEKDGLLTGQSLMGRMLGVMNRGGLDAIGPSRLNMGGMGRWMFKKMMKAKNVATLPELRNMAVELGIQMTPCQMSMDVMEIGAKDLIPEACAPVGVAAMLEYAQHSKIQFFI